MTRRTLTDLQAGVDRSPVRVSELAAIRGVAREEVRRDVLAGELGVLWLHGRGARQRYEIPWTEARRYLQRLGLWKLDALDRAKVPENVAGRRSE